MTRLRDPVAWVVTLFLGNFLLQRLSLPNLSIPLTVPFSVLWMGLALYYKVVAVDYRRLVLWLMAAGLSALVMLAQLVWVEAPFISVTSWGYWVVIWLLVVVHVRDRSSVQFVRMMRAIARCGCVVSSLSVLFVALQLLGLRYRDYLAELVPSSLLVQGYVISYPISYGSPIFKSNAWLALEPSFLSFMLGICIICGILSRVRAVAVLWMALGLIATTAGSGIAIVGLAVLIMLATGRARLLRPYVVPALALGAVAAFSPFGQAILVRATEVTQARSSTSLRAIEPYLHLWPEWATDAATVFFGRGAGSSRWIIDNAGVGGLLVPSVAKVLFDYGLIAGAALFAVMISTYVRSPEPVLALALAASMLTLQSASPPLVLCSIAVVSLWVPRAFTSPESGVSDLRPVSTQHRRQLMHTG